MSRAVRFTTLLAALLGTAAPLCAQRFVPRVDAIPVHDRDGRKIATPFLGGLDVPRPQLLDIDGDGDLDLFVQERSGEIKFFERVGDDWVWRTDRFEDVDVGEWYRFVDLDRDGLWDLLGESRYSLIRAWRNTGTANSPRLTLVADTLLDADGEALFADRQNILNLVDIDCNNRLDLFVGRVSGSIDRYEAEPGLGSNGLPRFRKVTENWEGIEIIGDGAQPGAPMPRGSSRHGANTMAFGDIDGDGDQDLLWGDFFEPGLLLITNDGDCPHFSFRGTPRPFPVGAPVNTTGYNAPAPGDVDGDGLLDVVIGVIGGAFGPSRSSVDNLYLLRQESPGEWRTVTSRLIPMIDVGSESTPTLGDIDGDGDLDLLIGNRIDPGNNKVANIFWYENVGTATEPSFVERGTLPGPHEFQSAPVLVDLDGDGLLDLVVGSWRDQVQFWRNTGTAGAPAWTLADTALVTITRGSNTTPALADIDGDGLLDLVIGESTGQVNLYRNVGTRTQPSFELVSDNFQAIDVGRRSAPLLADLSGDGKPDLLIGSEEGELRLWINRSTPGEFRFEADADFVLLTDPYAAPAAGDLDGDGDLDLIVGTLSGGLRHLEATNRP
jgi:hypothetical protein